MLSQFFDAKNRENFANALAPLLFWQTSQSVSNIFFRGQMREQCQGLKDVSDSPLRRWNMDRADGIEENIAAKKDSSLVRPRQPGDAIKQRGFAGTGSSKQNRAPRRNFDGNVENKRRGAGAVPLLANLRGEHRAVYFAAHGVHTRRFTA